MVPGKCTFIDNHWTFISPVYFFYLFFVYRVHRISQIPARTFYLFFSANSFNCSLSLQVLSNCTFFYSVSGSILLAYCHIIFIEGVRIFLNVYDCMFDNSQRRLWVDTLRQNVTLAARVASLLSFIRYFQLVSWLQLMISACQIQWHFQLSIDIADGDFIWSVQHFQCHPLHAQWHCRYSNGQQQHSPIECFTCWHTSNFYQKQLFLEFASLSLNILYIWFLIIKRMFRCVGEFFRYFALACLSFLAKNSELYWFLSKRRQLAFLVLSFSVRCKLCGTMLFVIHLP